MSKRIWIRFIKVLALGILMLMLAAGGYYAAKKITGENNKNLSDIAEKGEVFEAETPSDLPVGITGTYSPEESTVIDTNDYLVACRGNLVSLFIINADGEEIFEKILDISPDSLQESDRALLNEGIILDTKAELLSLIEDYSS